MANNPELGLVYIPVLEPGALFGPSGELFIYRQRQCNLGATYLDGEQLSSAKQPKEWPSLDTLLVIERDPTPRTLLRAWDPSRQAEIWEVDTSAPGSRPSSGNPADVITTAGGLVFQGQADGRLLVFEAKTGRQVHSIDAGLKIGTAPMTYRVGGEQYSTVMGTSNTGTAVSGEDCKQGRIAAFKLGGGEVPHPSSVARGEGDLTSPAPNTGTPQQISLGEQLSVRHCAVCHESASRALNLAHLNAKGHREFLDITLKDRRLDGSMPERNPVDSGGGCKSENAGAQHRRRHHFNARHEKLLFGGIQ
jgi:quinohemoprotein ethanol dehydrogenase